MTITGNTGLAARAQRDAAQFNLKLKFKNKKKIKPQAASYKQQAASSNGGGAGELARSFKPKKKCNL
jgi:hypothetical protein